MLATADLQIHADNTDEEHSLSLAVGTTFGLLFQVTPLYHTITV